MGKLFWQNNSLVTRIIFELCLFMIFSPVFGSPHSRKKVSGEKVLKSTENGKFAFFDMMYYFQLFLHIALIQCTRGKMSDFMLNLITTKSKMKSSLKMIEYFLIPKL